MASPSLRRSSKGRPCGFLDFCPRFFLALSYAGATFRPTCHPQPPASHMSFSALTNARAFFWDHCSGAGPNRGTCPFWHSKSLRLRGLQPAEDTCIGRRQLGCEEIVGDVVEQALDEVGGSITPW